MQTVKPSAADAPVGVTHTVAGKPYTSSTTTFGVDGAVASVDLYGFARTFDHVRLDYRADGTVATRTLLDAANPAAAIVIDYDEAGAAMARHEIELPGRPYARADIRYDADGAVTERTRSGFASGDLASITVRFDAHGAIVAVEHLQIDGSRTIVGTSAANMLGGNRDDPHAGHDGADTFVLLEGGTQQVAVADFHQSQDGHIDLSHVLGEGTLHFLGDGAALEVRFDHVGAGVLVPANLDGDKIDDAGVLLAGAHAVVSTDLIF